MFTIGGRTHHAGQAGGAQPDARHPALRRPCSTSGQYNAEALATTVVPLERMREAYEAGRVPDDGDGHHDGVKTMHQIHKFTVQSSEP